MALEGDSQVDLFARHVDSALKDHHDKFLEKLSGLNDAVGEIVFLMRDGMNINQSSLSESDTVERKVSFAAGHNAPLPLTLGLAHGNSSSAEKLSSSANLELPQRIKPPFAGESSETLKSEKKCSIVTIGTTGINSNGQFSSEGSLPNSGSDNLPSFKGGRKQQPPKNQRSNSRNQNDRSSRKSFLYRAIAGTNHSTDSFLSDTNTFALSSRGTDFHLPHEQSRTVEGSKSRYAVQLEAQSIATVNPIRARVFLKEIVMNDQFDGISMAMITLNGIFVGIHTELFSATKKDDMPIPIVVLEWIFCIFFLVELILRIVAFKLKFFYNANAAWNISDLIIVALSVFELMMATFSSSEKSGTFSMVRLIRVLRMFRVMRMIRVIHFFREFRILTLAILNALKSLVWALLLLVFIMYVVACVITSGVASSPDLDTSSYDILRKHWSTLGRSIYSLFMAIFGGVSWNDIVDPIHQVGAFYQFVFVFYVAFVQLAVLNVVTGVFCENAIKSATRDDEEVMREQMKLKEAYVVRLMKLFEDCKSTELGQITFKDFEDKMEDDKIKAYFSMLDLAVDDGRTLFKLLDTDDSGMLNLDEFVTGCLQLKGFAKSIDMAQIYKKMNYVEHQVQDMRKNIAAMKKGPMAFQRPVDAVNHQVGIRKATDPANMLSDARKSEAGGNQSASVPEPPDSAATSEPFRKVSFHHARQDILESVDTDDKASVRKCEL